MPYLEIKRLKPGVIPSLDDISNDISSLEGVDPEQVPSLKGPHGFQISYLPKAGFPKS